jgi:hypothetical protein
MSIIIDWGFGSSYDKGILLIHSGIDFLVLRNSLSSPSRLKRTRKLDAWSGCTFVGVDKSRVWNCGLFFAVEFIKSLKVSYLVVSVSNGSAAPTLLMYPGSQVTTPRVPISVQTAV